MIKGKCKLCLQPDKDLRDSHFMPRSLDALLRTREYEPVRFSQEAMYPSNRPTKDYVFCGDCEQLFNREGENWVMPLLPAVGGPFPLRERLMKQAPISRSESWSLYGTATNPGIDVPKLTHFAVGIFYKAAVHSWRGDSTEPYMELADGEIEALRLYLLDKADLPKTMALGVTVDSLSVVWQGVRPPYRAEHRHRYKYCLFYVPGVLFQLLIGEGVQETMMANCINANALRPVLVEDVSKPMRNTTREETAKARRTKKLKETTAEIEAKGLSIRLGE